jgi:hypothetical protein
MWRLQIIFVLGAVPAESVQNIVHLSKSDHIRYSEIQHHFFDPIFHRLRRGDVTWNVSHFQSYPSVLACELLEELSVENRSGAASVLWESARKIGAILPVCVGDMIALSGVNYGGVDTSAMLVRYKRLPSDLSRIHQSISPYVCTHGSIKHLDKL